jgi:hypothetical protein
MTNLIARTRMHSKILEFTPESSVTGSVNSIRPEGHYDAPKQTFGLRNLNDAV